MNKGKTKFELNRRGVGTLLKSNEMRDFCEKHAQRVQHLAGDGYDIGSYTGPNRVKTNVYARSDEARQDNIENNTLLKALEAARK